MRTSNCKCVICKSPLYRRPSELKKVNFVCCKKCRSEAYKKYPNIIALNNLELGREKGTNHLGGIPKSKESNIKRSKSHKLYCKLNPDKVRARGEKIRGKNHYRWKGGISALNQSIRAMTENRKWMDIVKLRDGYQCVECESGKELESHHIVSLNFFIEKYNIQNRQDARDCKELWDIKNGLTLCRKCHYRLEGREYKNVS